MTAHLDELNQRVSEAIFRAEHEPEGTPEAEKAFREVSRLEEQIAQVMPVDDLQGAIARIGAVSAALRAGDWLRAERLADAYMTGAPADLVEQLREFAAEAERVASTFAEPDVRPIAFVLRAA
jgi:hypothetical protein